MSRKAVFVILAVLFVIGAAGVGFVAVKWFTRDRVAMGTYRMEGVPGMSFSEAIEAEELTVVHTLGAAAMPRASDPLTGVSAGRVLELKDRLGLLG